MKHFCNFFKNCCSDHHNCSFFNSKKYKYIYSTTTTRYMLCKSQRHITTKIRSYIGLVLTMMHAQQDICSVRVSPQVSKGSVDPQLHPHFRNQMWECGLKSCSPRMVIKLCSPNERQSSLPLDLRGSLKGLILKVRNSESVTFFLVRISATNSYVSNIGEVQKCRLKLHTPTFDISV